VEEKRKVEPNEWLNNNYRLFAMSLDDRFFLGVLTAAATCLIFVRRLVPLREVSRIARWCMKCKSMKTTPHAVNVMTLTNFFH